MGHETKNSRMEIKKKTMWIPKHTQLKENDGVNQQDDNGDKMGGDLKPNLMW